jgi:hypothetical protein
LILPELTMKSTCFSFATLVMGTFFANAQGSHYTNGYTKSNGTYVQGHYSTNPNNTTSDNWSTRGNVNPVTGAPGTKSPSSGGYTGASGSGYTGSSGSGYTGASGSGYTGSSKSGYTGSSGSSYTGSYNSGFKK